MAITLNDITNNRIFQRGYGLTTTSIIVSGTYTSTDPANVQARVVNIDDESAVLGWTQLTSATIGSGAFTGTLAGIPQGAWYRLEVRKEDSSTEVDIGSNQFGVGIVTAIIGQSNGVGWYTDGTAVTPNSKYVRYTTAGGYVTESATGDGVVTFANTIIEALDIPVCVICGRAVSGSGLTIDYMGISYWLHVDKVYYNLFKTDLDAVGGDLEFVIWAQGETDGWRSVSEADYETGLGTLLSWLETDITRGANFNLLIQELGRDNTLTAITDAIWQGIRNAQQDFSAANSNVYIAATTMDQDMDDTIHFSDAGYTTIAERAAQTFLYINDDQSYYRGPQISNADILGADNIDVFFTHSGGSDITPASGTVFGFEVTGDGSDLTVTEALRSSATSIRLTITEDLTAYSTVVVTHLYGRRPEGWDSNTAPTNIIHDNSDLALPVENLRAITALVPVPECADFTVTLESIETSSCADFTVTFTSLQTTASLNKTYQALRGVMNELFKIGGTGGNQIKNESGCLEIRNSGDTAYQNLKAKDGSDDDHLVTYRQLQALAARVAALEEA